MKAQSYYAARTQYGTDVIGYPVKLKADPQHDYFVYNAKENRVPNFDWWYVCEVTSGRAVCDGESRQYAIRRANSKIHNFIKGGGDMTALIKPYAKREASDA